MAVSFQYYYVTVGRGNWHTVNVTEPTSYISAQSYPYLSALESYGGHQPIVTIDSTTPPNESWRGPNRNSSPCHPVHEAIPLEGSINHTLKHYFLDGFLGCVGPEHITEDTQYGMQSVCSDITVAAYNRRGSWLSLSPLGSIAYICLKFPRVVFIKTTIVPVNYFKLWNSQLLFRLKLNAPINIHFSLSLPALWIFRILFMSVPIS